MLRPVLDSLETSLLSKKTVTISKQIIAVNTYGVHSARVEAVDQEERVFADFLHNSPFYAFLLSAVLQELRGWFEFSLSQVSHNKLK